MKSPDGPAAGPGHDPTVAAASGLAAVGATLSHESVQSLAALRGTLKGYQVGAVLGRGGMGEVVLAHDEDIGRDVAIKRMIRMSPSDEAVTRFMREARIQARLEHPAIVPVHELGRDAHGQPYFTMKRLVGTTLAQMLEATPPPSRQRLLRAFADVCTAVAFAHSRGVIHRDLKPANIMLGDFGEVYVLDWGLARVLAEADGGTVGAGIDSLDEGPASGVVVTPSLAVPHRSVTLAGAVLGTPGYMAPEQVRASNDISTPADVYALGSILFEILAGEWLHDHASNAMVSTTSGTVGRSAAARAPDRGVPPELDALCAQALVMEPTARPTAAELAAQIESFLDGDRDLEHRKKLATEWLGKATAALAADPVHGRAAAMRHAGRALALDPDSEAAADVITRLMLEPGKELPVALGAELARSEGAQQRRQGRVALASFAAIAIVMVLGAANGLRSIGTLAVVASFTAVLAAVAFMVSRRAVSRTEMLCVAIGNAVLAAMMSRMFGSLITAPTVTCVMALSLTSYPQLIDRARLVIAILLASWLLPVVLERAGVLQATWSVEGEQIISRSAMFDLGGSSTSALLIAANLGAILVIGRFANALARARRDAQRQVEIQAWHLRQLLPAPSEPA